MDTDIAHARLASGMAVPIGAEYRRGIHDMLLMAVRGSVPRGVCQGPHFRYKCAFPRLSAELPGFTITPCNVGKGNEKGRVENGVGYVKKNFLAGLDIPDFQVLNPAARHWLDTVANVRVHGETREPPTVLWHTERPALRPVPLHPFDIATVSQVRASRQFRITVETNRYSVPAQY